MLQFVIVLPYIDTNQPWMYMCSPSWTPFPPASPSHPSGSSQCTSHEHRVSCIRPRLTICFIYDNIPVSMLFFQITPPLPSPTESKRLFFSCSLFCCLINMIIVTIFLNCIYMLWYTVLVFFFLAYFTLYHRLQFHPPH